MTSKVKLSTNTTRENIAALRKDGNQCFRQIVFIEYNKRKQLQYSEFLFIIMGMRTNSYCDNTLKEIFSDTYVIEALKDTASMRRYMKVYEHETKMEAEAKVEAEADNKSESAFEASDETLMPKEYIAANKELNNLKSKLKRAQDTLYELETNNLYENVIHTKQLKMQVMCIKAQKILGKFDIDEHLQKIENTTNTITKYKAEIRQLQKRIDKYKIEASSKPYQSIIPWLTDDLNKPLCDKVWNRRSNR